MVVMFGGVDKAAELARRTANEERRPPAAPAAHDLHHHRNTAPMAKAKDGDVPRYNSATGLYEPAAGASALVAEVALGLSQSIPNNVLTTLTFPTSPDTWDYNYGLSVEPNPTNRIRVPVGGVYHLEVSVMFNTNATGERYVAVSDGGHSFIEGYANIDSTGYATFHGSRDAFLVLDEAPFVRVRQTSGGSLMVLDARLSVRQVLATAGPNGRG